MAELANQLEAEEGSERPGWVSRIEGMRRRSVSVRAADTRVRAVDLERRIKELGVDGPTARKLDQAAEAQMQTLLSLSSLTAPMAVDYLERLSGPIAALSGPVGVQIVARSYLAHVAVELDPTAYGAADIPVLGTLPPLKKGRPPQDIVMRAVKASRRNFEAIRAVSTPVWTGFVTSLVKRVHDIGSDEGFVAEEVVDGLARYGWVLRQVDIHYGLEPQRRGATE